MSRLQTLAAPLNALLTATLALGLAACGGAPLAPVDRSKLPAPAAEEAPWTPPPVTTWTLTNGIEVWLVEQRQAHPDVAVALIDESPSQDIGERAIRREQALEALQSSTAGLPNLEWRLVRAGAPSAAAPGTRLFSSWRQALADVPAGRRAGIGCNGPGTRYHIGEDRLSRGHAGARHGP